MKSNVNGVVVANNASGRTTATSITQQPQQQIGNTSITNFGLTTTQFCFVFANTIASIDEYAFVFVFVVVG